MKPGIATESWMCVRCGYMMDTATCMNHDSVTEVTDGDSLSLCLNCAAVYERRSGKWILMTAEERAALPAEAKADIIKAQIVQALVADKDLAAKPGRA